MRVLVTGAGGYIGRAVVATLGHDGHTPVAMVHSKKVEIYGAAEVRRADLLDSDSLRAAVQGMDAVCHLAGLTRARESFAEPLRYMQVNATGTVKLLSAMESEHVNHIVFASTGAIYGEPENQPMNETFPDSPPHPYASSKLAAELAIGAQVSSGKIGAIIVRILNVASGFHDDPTRLVPRVVGSALNATPLKINGDGTVVRDYLHIQDAAQAFVACIDHLPEVGHLTRYNVGSGRGTTIMEIVSAVERITGRQIGLEHLPPAREPTRLVNNPTKAMTELDWMPVHSSIDEIVRDSLGVPAANL